MLKGMSAETFGFGSFKVLKKVAAVNWTAGFPAVALGASTGLFSCVGLHFVLEA